MSIAKQNKANDSSFISAEPESEKPSIFALFNRLPILNLPPGFFNVGFENETTTES